MTTTNYQHKGLSGRLKSSALVCGLAAMMIGSSALATPEDQAKKMHDRLTGNLPSESVLSNMTAQLSDPEAGAYAAAMTAIENDEDHSFYNVTLKNMAAPWTNRDFDIFAPLNDYMATVVGIVQDDLDFRTVLWEDVVYVGGDSALPAYSVSDNAHYSSLEAGLDVDGDPGFSLRDDLVRRTQSETVPAFASGGASGVVTSRAGARAFLIAGTNRAAFRFTLLNHLCIDMEQVHDVTLVPDRIRQDVSRSPGGDSRIFINNCMGCHAGMDPMAQALAYHNWAYNVDNDPMGDDGEVEYITTAVQPKYFNNENTFPQGFITPDDSWRNYWRQGKNSVLGWDESLPGSGSGASSMFQELAHTRQFAQCHVKRVFKNVCLREAQSADDASAISTMVTEFMEGTSGPNGNVGNLKRVFARSAAYCVAGEI